MRKTLFALTIALCFSQANAWALFDEFKRANVLVEGEEARVLDASDARQITTSEGQSYALFFALVADDEATFKRVLAWTEQHLAAGEITRQLPSWLWGQKGQQNKRNKVPRWGIIDTNNAMDSDMWIAYALLEAGRIWQKPAYTAKARRMLALMKTQLRTLPTIGQVLLPGRVGFESETRIKLNPSYYPPFILKRFAQEDAQWLSVYEGSVRLLLRSAPSGIAPDWCEFTPEGVRRVNADDVDTVIGSYNAIRVYLWIAMMSPNDPNTQVLMRHFNPYVQLAQKLNFPPEKVDVNTLAVNRPGNLGFAASVLPMVAGEPLADYWETLLRASEVVAENYYTNVLTLFGLGFYQKAFAFDEKGYLVRPKG